MQHPTQVTLVTAQNSGTSYLNHVKLQNGCLSHANLFIHSNLQGSCFNPETGRIDQERLRRNIELATDIYISRAKGAPCGDTAIQLFKGADSSAKQHLQNDVLVFQKGTKEQKEQLKQRNPGRWGFFEEVWAVRNRHIVCNLPPQYVFSLRCCLAPDCIHPLCKQAVQLPRCMVS